MCHLDSAKKNLLSLQDLHQDLESNKEELEEYVANLHRQTAALLKEISILQKHDEMEIQSQPLIEADSQATDMEVLTHSENEEQVFRENEPVLYFTNDNDDDNDDEEALQDNNYAFDNVDMVKGLTVVAPSNTHRQTSLASSSTSPTDTITVVSVPKKNSQKKQRVSKAFIMSPRKWRRMMRSHRLQSILIET